MKARLVKFQNKCNVIRLSSLLSFLFLTVCASPSKAQCTEVNHAFSAGEIVKFSAYYNWNFIWVNAGEVTFTTALTTYNNQPAYFLKAVGNTFKGYDFFYSVRDTFEAVVDTLHLRPLYYKQSSNEGRFNSLQFYWFDQQKKSVKTSVRMEHDAPKSSEIGLGSCTADVLSMVYKTRNMDFSKYQYNEKIPISMILDGKIENLYVRYLGLEEVEDRQNRRFRCYKFSPMLPKNAIFDGGEEMTVWVTSDSNRIPIVVEAKILIGSVKAVFLDAQNLKQPMESRIR